MNGGLTGLTSLGLWPCHMTFFCMSYYIYYVHLRHYTFRYDTRASRPQQLGALGEDLETYMPEAVEVAASRTFPNPEKGKPAIVLKDIAIVDKNQLFMYNLGATQELLVRQVRRFGEAMTCTSLVGASQGCGGCVGGAGRIERAGGRD